jgi:transcriptional regulator with XRE-family HTH domain
MSRRGKAQSQQYDRAVDSALGSRIFNLRAAAALTQAEFAAAAGVSKPVITRCEHGEVTPDLKTILGIASAFGVSVNWLVTGQGPIFDDEPPGLVKLSQPDDVHSFRAAVQLLSASPVPLDFALLEYVPAKIGEGFAVTGGIWLQTDWLAKRRCGLLLPNSLSAYEKVAWLSTWVSAGHRFHGAFTLSRDKANELSMMSSGFVPESQAGRVAWPWLVRITQDPDRVLFPEIDQVRGSFPTAQVERLEAVIRGLASRSPSSHDRDEFINLINEHPELVPRLHTLARQLLSERPQENVVKPSHVRKERK